MAFNPQLTDASVNAAIAAFLAIFDSGYLRIYDGAQPANANAAITTQVLLAELRFDSTAFGAPTAGVATANAITSDTSANATGIASWFRAFKSDGTTVVMDGTVGSSGSFDTTINSTNITSGGTVSCSNFQVTLPEN